MTADVTATVSALRQRGDEVVERLLRENEARWECLSSADSERLEALAQEVASRLLGEPAARLETAPGENSFHYASALRELFGLRPDDVRGTAG